MKKIIVLASVLFFSLTGFSSSNTYVITDITHVSVSDIQFKVINDTNTDFSYFVGNEMKVIAKGQSVGFSYAENTIIYNWTNNQKGGAWFTVTADMHGKSFNLSSLLSKN